MVTLEVLPNINTYKFSSKSDIVYIPETYNTLSDEEKIIIQEFCNTVHNLYIKNLAEFKAHFKDKHPCAIQLRYQAINETKVMMELKFSKDKFNATFNKFIMPNKERRGRYKTTFKSVRPKKFTKLDHIESDLSDDMV